MPSFGRRRYQPGAAVLEHSGRDPAQAPGPARRATGGARRARKVPESVATGFPAADTVRIALCPGRDARAPGHLPRAIDRTLALGAHYGGAPGWQGHGANLSFGI